VGKVDGVMHFDFGVFLLISLFHLLSFKRGQRQTMSLYFGDFLFYSLISIRPSKADVRRMKHLYFGDFLLFSFPPAVCQKRGRTTDGRQISDGGSLTKVHYDCNDFHFGDFLFFFSSLFIGSLSKKEERQT